MQQLLDYVSIQLVSDEMFPSAPSVMQDPAFLSISGLKWQCPQRPFKCYVLLLHTTFSSHRVSISTTHSDTTARFMWLFQKAWDSLNDSESHPGFLLPVKSSHSWETVGLFEKAALFTTSADPAIHRVKRCCILSCLSSGF